MSTVLRYVANIYLLFLPIAFVFCSNRPAFPPEDLFKFQDGVSAHDFLNSGAVSGRLFAFFNKMSLDLCFPALSDFLTVHMSDMLSLRLFT